MGVQEEAMQDEAMSQYQKEQISVHSNAVTCLSMTALITLCPAFVLSLYALPSDFANPPRPFPQDNGFSCYVITLVTYYALCK